MSGLKRAFDVTGSLVLLAILAPVLAAAALAVRLGSGGPVLFRQERLGRQGRPFTILKLRTMVAGAEATGPMTGRNDPRITRVGAVLRKYRLDVGERN